MISLPYSQVVDTARFRGLRCRLSPLPGSLWGAGLRRRRPSAGAGEGDTTGTTSRSSSGPLAWVRFPSVDRPLLLRIACHRPLRFPAAGPGLPRGRLPHPEPPESVNPRPTWAGVGRGPPSSPPGGGGRTERIGVRDPGVPPDFSSGRLSPSPDALRMLPSPSTLLPRVPPPGGGGHLWTSVSLRHSLDRLATPVGWWRSRVLRPHSPFPRPHQYPPRPEAPVVWSPWSRPPPGPVGWAPGSGPGSRPGSTHFAHHRLSTASGASRPRSPGLNTPGDPPRHPESPGGALRRRVASGTGAVPERLQGPSAYLPSGPFPPHKRPAPLSEDVSRAGAPGPCLYPDHILFHHCGMVILHSVRSAPLGGGLIPQAGFPTACAAPGPIRARVPAPRTPILGVRFLSRVSEGLGVG